MSEPKLTMLSIHESLCCHHILTVPLMRLHLFISMSVKDYGMKLNAFLNYCIMMAFIWNKAFASIR